LSTCHTNGRNSYPTDLKSSEWLRFYSGVKSRSKTSELQCHRDLFVPVHAESDYLRQRRTKAGGRFSQTIELFEIELKYVGSLAANFLAGGRHTEWT